MSATPPGELASFMSEQQFPQRSGSVPQCLAGILDSQLADRANRLALVEPGGAWTYRELAAAVEQAKCWLRDSGVRPGDRVVLVCENCRAFVALFFATAGIGAWPVLVNARLSHSDLDQIRDHSGARLMLYMVAASPQAMKHAVRHGAQIVDRQHLGRIAIGSVNQDALPEPPETDPSNNIAAMIYTSGTTGVPKGVMLSHQNLLFMASGSNWVRSLTANDRLVGVLPMSHAVGLSVVLLGSLLSGATLYLCSRFDPAAMLELLDREKITILLGSPSMFALLSEYAKLKGASSLHFPALRVISASGASLDPVVKARTERLFGVVLHNGYGVTECSPTIALTRIDAPRTDTSVGAIFPGVEARLVDADGNAVPEGQVGELRVRGPNVMRGYYRSPEETRRAIDADGWFNTRDLARIEEGNLFIVGRTKDLIIRFGFNVYPAEVEAVLNSHPGVLRCAVMGRAAAEGGEEVVAFVEKKSDCELGVTELGKFAAKHLTTYKQPTVYILLERLPLTPTGKVMKDALARMSAGAATPESPLQGNLD